ncbi:hypothetical protein [Pyrobaculum aerophilum]|uniref:hypothetical protein n=1 Tax=Pyrobaculum aerophilum TaxID=13773 RepID=UPI0023F57B87|nr:MULTISPECIES: hypothetical protein [Pyrobaculum]MCX8135719.1 hypothetical protein [Pyrobaculum aerophilum]
MKSLFTAAILAAVVMLIIIASVGVVGSGIRGVVKISTDGVEMEPAELQLDLAEICSGKEVRVGAIRAEKPVEIKFSVQTATKSAGGNVTVAGGLKARLVGGQEYVIHMPCAVATGPCYRIMVIIPGYDAPLEIAPGNYDFYLSGSCTTEGNGWAELEVNVVLKNAKLSN